MNWYKTAQYKLIIPPILYHATFGANLESIKQRGLDPNYIGIVKCWRDCYPGIYLMEQPDKGVDYVLEADNPEIPEEWYNNIIALEINTTSLDQDEFEIDPNLDPRDAYDSYLYKRVIPYSAVRAVL